ncbi:MAG: hypothetical protein ABSD75_11655 [Terriglobales bacterium]|jgi:hypothetical protein
MAKTILLALEFLFGCWHRNLSRPFTLSGWTYEVCLNCGKKLAYNRAEIGYKARHGQKASHHRESLHDDYRSPSPVAPPQQERVKLA